MPEMRAIRFAVPSLFEEASPGEIAGNVASAHFNTILCTVRPSVFQDARFTTLVEAAHARGIRFHAVISTMAAGQVEPDNEKEDPSTRAVNSAGRQSAEWLCPSSPRVREWVRKLAGDLALSGSDGVQLDYIRFGRPDLCHCPRCRAHSAAWLGQHPGCTWDDWRDSVIGSFIEEARAGVKAVAEGKVFSCSLWTAGEGQRRTYMTPEGEGYGWRQGQNFDVIAGLADFVRPILYSCMLLENGGWILDMTRLAVRNAAGRTEVVPGVALTVEEEWKKCHMPPEDLDRVLAGLKETGAAGSALFSYGSLFAEKYAALGYLDVVRRSVAR